MNVNNIKLYRPWVSLTFVCAKGISVREWERGREGGAFIRPSIKRPLPSAFYGLPPLWECRKTAGRGRDHSVMYSPSMKIH